jgi:seryl-tRNA synthetase
MTQAQTSFGQPKASPEELLQALFRPMGVDGVYGRTGQYEAIVEALATLIARQREPGTEVFRFPPVVSRALIEKSGYLKSFPHLLGCVACLSGSERAIGAAVERFEAGEDWTGAVAASDLVLAPAACYPIYPLAAARGPVPADGLKFDVACDCFRREPSRNIDRLQSFRMREYVFIGPAPKVQQFRERWMPKAMALADALGLSYRVEAASDPFFGRGGVLVSKQQVSQELKFELLVPVRSAEEPTACMSFNYHRDHFGLTWNMRDEAGEPVHTGCIAFGMDRLAVALFAAHGATIDQWPPAVRAILAI